MAGASNLALRQQGPRTADLLGVSTQHARLGTLKSFLAWLTNPPDGERTLVLEFTRVSGNTRNENPAAGKI